MKVEIIAEAGVNHNGDVDIAKKMIEVAAHAGADFVKFQTFKAELLATDRAPTRNAKEIRNHRRNARGADQTLSRIKN